MKLFFLLLLLILISFSNSTLLFKIKDLEPQCLGGDFYKGSVLVVKYKVFTQSRKPLTKVLPHLKIYLRNVKAIHRLNEHALLMNKGKITFDIKETSLYDVCIRLDRVSAIKNLKEDLYANLKINPDNFVDEEKYFTNAINTKDVDSLNQKTRQVISLTRPIIDNQKNQLLVENEYSLKTLVNANHYKYLSYAQLVIIGIIGIVQICNFRRFLKSQNVI